MKSSQTSKEHLISEIERLQNEIDDLHKTKEHICYNIEKQNEENEYIGWYSKLGDCRELIRLKKIKLQKFKIECQQLNK